MKKISLKKVDNILMLKSIRMFGHSLIIVIVSFDLFSFALSSALWLKSNYDKIRSTFKSVRCGEMVQRR